jgi:RNA polymerase sigma-70 factor (ECF subfamily)
VDDRKLIEGLRRGDRKAFEELVDGYSPSLMRLAMTHVPSRAVAEEVVQDTWIGVMKGIDQFEGRSSLRSWIFTILLNIARTRGEREKRILPFASLRRRAEEGRDEPAVDPDRFQGRRGEAPGAWAQPPAEWSDPQHQLDTAEVRGVMLGTIRGLPPRQREVIAIRDLQGWDAEDACSALDLTESNQRVLLHRARSKVRAAVEDHLSESGATEPL